MRSQQRSLVFFPEGTRGNPGKILPFKRGAASFSLSLNAPILPAVIYGSHKAWPKDKIFMRPTGIRVYILEPIFPDSFLDNNNPDEDDLTSAADEMTAVLERRITEKTLDLYE